MKTDETIEEFLARGGQVRKLADSRTVMAERHLARLIRTEPEPSAVPERLRRRHTRRNWQAQARYDEAHGTVNGSDPRIEEMRAMWAREQ